MSRQEFVSSASKYVTTLVSFLSTKAIQQVNISCRDPDFLAATETSSFNSASCRNTTILFLTNLHVFFPFSVATYCLLSRPSSIVNNQIMVLRHRKCCWDMVSLVIDLKFVTTHKFQSRHRLLQVLFFSSFLLEFYPF